MTAASLVLAREFLALPRVAVVGASREPRAFSRMILRELLRRGIDAVPVNPGLEEAEGRRAFAAVGDVRPPVQGALLMTPPARAEELVRACAAAGVRWVWFHRGGGPGAGTPEAAALARTLGLQVVEGLCPMMALPGAGWFHRLHAFLRTRARR